MQNFVIIIMAAMIDMILPGKSMYSQTVIPICDEVCQSTPLCDNPHDWKCKPPRFSQALYEEQLATHSDQAEARLHSFTRTETYEEGLVRYKIIAQGISNVSERSTRHICNTKCNDAYNQCTDTSCNDQAKIDLEACRIDCITSAPWTGTRKDLAFSMAVATNQESGFRSDVHGGTGWAGRGDCNWANADGKAVPADAKGARVVPGSCRSVCLGQINIGKGKTKEGWTAQDLVGIDLASTERCLTVVARNLAMARGYCARTAKQKDWAKGMFAAYGSGGSCRITMKKVVNIGGNRQIHYAYKTKLPSGKIKIVWAAYAPDDAIDRNAAEEQWPGHRARMVYSYEKRMLTLNDMLTAKLSEPEIDGAYQMLSSTSIATYWMEAIQ